MFFSKIKDGLWKTQNHSYCLDNMHFGTSPQAELSYRSNVVKEAMLTLFFNKQSNLDLYYIKAMRIAA